jgi:hypothetical protein
MSPSLFAGARGHIQLICNMLRLTAASQTPSQYVPSMLASHHQWPLFLPRLRADTMQQAVYGIDGLMTNPTLTRPPPHVGPLPPPDAASSPGSGGPARQPPDLTYTSIDLGSVCTPRPQSSPGARRCAALLGLRDAAAHTQTHTR